MHEFKDTGLGEWDDHDHFDTPPGCFWIEHPGGDYILLTGSTQSTRQVGYLHFTEDNEWVAFCVDWGDAPIGLRRTYELAEWAAQGLSAAIEEGPSSDRWRKVTNNWTIYRHDKHDISTHHFRWHFGDTYEVVMGEDLRWNVLVNGDPVAERIQGGAEGQPKSFRQLARAKAFFFFDSPDFE